MEFYAKILKNRKFLLLDLNSIGLPAYNSKMLFEFDYLRPSADVQSPANYNGMPHAIFQFPQNICN